MPKRNGIFTPGKISQKMWITVKSNMGHHCATKSLDSTSASAVVLFEYSS